MQVWPELAVQEIRAGHVRLGGDLTFAGFDRLTPLQQWLADAIQQGGRTVSFVPCGRTRTELCLARSRIA